MPRQKSWRRRCWRWKTLRRRRGANPTARPCACWLSTVGPAVITTAARQPMTPGLATMSGMVRGGICRGVLPSPGRRACPPPSHCAGASRTARRSALRWRKIRTRAAVCNRMHAAPYRLLAQRRRRGNASACKHCWPARQRTPGFAQGDCVASIQ